MAGDWTGSPQVDYATFNRIQMNNEPDWWNDEKFIQVLMNDDGKSINTANLLIYFRCLIN